MSDTQDQNPISTDTAAAPSTTAPTAITAYFPKRLRRGEVDEGALAQLLTYLRTIEENDRIAVPFSKLFESLENVSELRYTERSAWEGGDQNAFLFHADIALMFYDLLISLDLTDQKILTEKFEDIAPNNDGTLGKLIDLVKNYSSAAGRSQLYESEEKSLTTLFTNGNIHVAARFFLDYLEQLKNAPEEEKVEGESEQVGGATTATGAAEAATTAAALPTAGVPASAGDAGGAGGSDTAGSAGGSPTPPSSPPTREGIDVLDLKQKLFSPEARELTVRFSQIALIQLERAEGLPAGSLQNSPELREIFNKKAQDFLITAINQGLLEEYRRSPETALIAIGRQMMAVEAGFNDATMRAAIAQHLAQTLYKDANAATLQEAEQAPAAPETTEQFAQNLGKDPEAQQAIGQLINSDPAFTIDGEQHLVDITKQLNQYLKDIGTQQDKIFLAKQNIDNVLDALTMMEGRTEIFSLMDEKNFRILFGDEIPFNPNFVKEFLPEYWSQRRSALGKIYGTQLLNRESQFAITQMMDLLDKEGQAQLPNNDPQKVSEQVSEEVFKSTIAAPVNQILVFHRRAGTTVERTLRAVYSAEESDLKSRLQRYYSSLWNERLSLEQRERAVVLLGLAQPGTQEVVNLASSVSWVPPQLTLLNLNALDAGNFGALQPIAADGGQFQSPVAGARGLVGSVKNWNGFGKLAKRFGGKLTGKAAEKAVAETAGKAANAAVSAVGTPFLGAMADWFTKTAATKEGRRNLILGGLSSLIPLSSIGGWLGGALGSLIGWFTGGPAGAAIGGLLGSWTGFGIEQWLKNALSGAGGGGISIPTEGGGLGNIFDGGGGSGGATGAGGGGAGMSSVIPPGSEGAGAAGAGAGISAIGAQAVLTTVGLVTFGVMASNMVINNALLADFPVQDPLGTVVPGTQGKISDYVTIEKRVFVTGCAGNKCENPAFPLRAEYSIIIKPKGNYTLTVTDAFDQRRVNHSQKAWEEKGLTPPNIAERTKNINDFSPPNQSGAALYEGMTIEPGSSVEIFYAETYDQNYNDAMVSNYFEMSFDYADATSGKSGEDKAATSEVVLIGDYSQGAGCWPVNGSITQLPNGGYSHGGADAFDIAGNDRYPIFSPFDGKIASVGKSGGDYGTHFVLDADGVDNNLLFAHLSQIFVTEGQDVAAGQRVGLVGTTGRSSGPHLHFELLGKKVNPSALGILMGAPGIQVGDAVNTCYDMDTP